MQSTNYQIPLDENQEKIKISRIKGRKSICYLANLERLFILIGGKRIFSTISAKKRVDFHESGKHRSEGKSLKLVLELEKKSKPLARCIVAYNNHILLQLEDDHLEIYKFNQHEEILEIAQKLPMTCLRTDRCVSLGPQFLLFGKEGARAYTTAMVEHVLTQESISSATIAHGTIYLASPAHEIVEYAHPFYKPKALIFKTEIIDSLASLQNSICSLQAKKSTDLYQKTLNTAKSFSEPKAPNQKSTSVFDTLMNISTIKVDPSYEHASKKLFIHSSIETNTQVESFDLDEFGFLDRLESDGVTNLYLYGPASIKPLVHFNLTTKAFALLPIPEQYLIIDVLAIPHSSLVYILVGKKCDKQLVFVDSNGFTEFSEVQLIEGHIRLSSKKRAENDRDEKADLSDVMKALRRLEYRMERMESLLMKSIGIS